MSECVKLTFLGAYQPQAGVTYISARVRNGDASQSEPERMDYPGKRMPRPLPQNELLRGVFEGGEVWKHRVNRVFARSSTLSRLTYRS
jgi:hypothetical protein